MRRSVLLLIAVAVGGAFAVRAIGGDEPSPNASGPHLDASRQRRAIALARAGAAIQRPTIESYLDRSDRVLDRHPEAEDADHLADLVESMPVSDEEIRAYYDAHRDMFGNRSVQDAREPIERILRYHKALQHLEAAP